METKAEFVKEVKGILINFFDRDHNYQLVEPTEDQLWITEGPLECSFGFNIQDNRIGIYLERGIPEVPAILIAGDKYEDTVEILKKNLDLLLRKIDKILEFYHKSIRDLFMVKKDFEPSGFRLCLNDKGLLACGIYDGGREDTNDISQDIRVIFNPELDKTKILSWRSYNRYVNDRIEGYNTLCVARFHGIEATYLETVVENKTNRFCHLIKKSEDDVTGFPGWSSVMDMSKDLELFRRI